MADPTFDRRIFGDRLATRRMGRTLITRAEVESTNDIVWQALLEGLPDGTTAVADAQTRGRGRAGRRWHTRPGRGLALSIALVQGCERGRSAALSLVAGLALARALERFGVEARLKWPNDLLAGGRKLSGILCEGRRLANGGDAAVVGVGVNVREQREDFPAGLRDAATSLAMEGARVSREVVAAEFLNAFEPLWVELEEGELDRVLDAWKARASFWGRQITVRGPAGAVAGVAHDLDREGGLVLRLENGEQVTVLAGDVEVGLTEDGQ